VNLLKTKLRRTTAVLAGTVLGLAGVAALASPASAHSPVVLHSEPCLASNGSWAVIWKIGNDFRYDATVGEITATVKKTDGSESSAKVTGPIMEPGVVIPKYTAGDYKASIAAYIKRYAVDSDSLKQAKIGTPFQGSVNGRTQQPQDETVARRLAIEGWHQGAADDA